MLGSLLFIVGAALALFSIKVLIVCTEYTKAKSYGKLALKLYGQRAFSVTNALLMCNLYGTTVSYMVASGHLIAQGRLQFE